MSYHAQAPAEEAHRNPQAILQSQYPEGTSAVVDERSTPTLDVTALQHAARHSCWLSSQHQADAFINLASDWLRAGEPHLSPDPQERRVFDRFAAHQATWQGSLKRAMDATPAGHDQDCLRQISEAMQFAAQVGQELARRSREQAQRTDRVARLLPKESSAPFGYFKRSGPREPLVQCRSTDEGGIPLFVDPHAVLDPVVIEATLRERLGNRLRLVFNAVRRWPGRVRDLAHEAWHPYDGADDDSDKFVRQQLS